VSAAVRERGHALDADALRAGATLAVAATFAGSLAFVTAHPKNPDAPLQPPAAAPLPLRTAAPPSAAPSPPAARREARITLQPAVHQTAVPGLTFTHVS
jgi:hypothetical protein